MPTKKTVKKTAKKTVKKAVKKTATVEEKLAKKKAMPIGKGPLGYTTSNVFKAPISKVWAAATERAHLIKYFLDDMKGDYAKPGTVQWFWKEWGWFPIEVLKYKKNKELVMLMPEMGGMYRVTVRFEIVREKNKTIFRVHESGYARKDLKSAFMMCEGWTEFHTYLKAHLMGVDLRKA
jgi:uncharacterized protein YndB with AHSA1/START domain